MESFAFWYWFIAGCICVGPLFGREDEKWSTKLWVFLGGFMLLPMVFGQFWDEMWTKYGNKEEGE